jgi:hypothetical protein
MFHYLASVEVRAEGRGRGCLERFGFLQRQIRGQCCRLLLVWAVLGFAIAPAASEGPLVEFDFTSRKDAEQWKAANHISQIERTPDGLRVHISGPDPYLHGPARDYPEGRLLWLHLRLKSDEGGLGQIFYYTSAPAEANSVRFKVPAGRWHDVQVPMPALSPGSHLRIDPPGTGGKCLLQRLWLEERVVFKSPDWPQPKAPQLGPDVLVIESGDLKLLQSRSEIGAFEVEVAGQKAAVGNTKALIGYVITNQVRWMPVSTAGNVVVRQSNSGFGLGVSWLDPDGARWTMSTACAPAAPGAIEVETVVVVDQDRSVLYLPMLAVLPGVGSFGTNKNQGLFAGLEYLENEPSSSEADLTGPASWRQVPDRVKITFPLMAVEADDRYFGVMWEPQDVFSALFDSPDRQFNSGGHLMGILFPGSDGVNREERSLLPYQPEVLRANQPLTLRATLIGGRGTTVVPAIEQYVRLAGLPAVPHPGYSASEYYELAARGWLDSKVRETNLYRHAVWPGFGPQPAADAALWMFWLSGKVAAADLPSRLTSASADALRQVAPENYNSSQIGHNRYPLPSLIFGAVEENALKARTRGEALLKRFEAPGTIFYQPQRGGIDYGKTHWSREANGLTANVLVALLEAGAFSGDRVLIEAGLEHLRAMDKFRHTVPRGAQTWEIALHTPDIMASAHMVRAHTLAYELTGEADFLEQARYWAWSGVPFVYLTPPTSGPIGIYGTIPVLGATSWVAPIWIGLPVQWCGLVYADALYRFSRHDPDGPWRQLADGITVAGIQHTWPMSDPDRKGLLPDFFELRAQHRDGPAINPATVQLPAISYYNELAPYEFHVFRQHNLQAHVPGTLSEIQERGEGLAFKFRSWSPRPSHLLINGFSRRPEVSLNGQKIGLEAPHRYQPEERRLILYLEPDAAVELIFPAAASD